MEFLIQLAILWLLWLVSPRRWRKRLSTLFITLALLLMLFSPLGARLGIWSLTVWLPPDTGEIMDTIVVLGRGSEFRDLRIALVKELWQAKRAPQIFASGMMDARPMVQSLTELGVPSKHLGGEECSQSTWENGLFTAAFLYPQTKNILLVTDPIHLLRSFLVFRSLGFRVIPHASTLPAEISVQHQLDLLLREYVGLIQYALKGHLVWSAPKHLQLPSTEVTQKIQEWRCRA